LIVALTLFETLDTDQLSALLACVVRLDVKTAVAVPPPVGTLSLGFRV